MDNAEDIGEATKEIEAVAQMDDPVIVTLRDGKQVEIYKCKTKQVGSVLRVITMLFDELGVKKLGDIPEAKLDDPRVLLQLIAKSTDNIFDLAVGLCSIESIEVFEELDLDDSLQIIAAEYDLNKNFFFTRVLPMIRVPS